ncbi:MAG: DUF4954 family protein [Bacteroidales bacterium]|nr:DUF4954 family protein [Bacteroidales bacterium]
MENTKNYRLLKQEEIDTLTRLGNNCSDWTKVRVTDVFDPKLLHGNIFEGDICLGDIATGSKPCGGFQLQEGIANSTLVNVTIGNHPAIRDVHILSGYTIGDNAVLFNIGEMSCNGKLKPLEVMNENGERAILPFAGMTIGDAYMWARYRGRKVFMQKLQAFTDELLASPCGNRGHVGDCCTIMGVRTIRNVSIISREDDPTIVDGAIALCDGVVGRGCKVEHGVIAERFLLGEHVTLEFGLRLNDTVVGDNSTLARCEVGNSIIFPAHEQHHNNSFLIAGLIMGQSNIAAGGTIGSNHNSRTADNEISAGRGFWPGLCCSFKHSSRFASYCLLAKGDYPAELDITLPFALVNNNTSKDRLEVMPAYWWMYNMYAMDRNSKKFAKRDKRVNPAQNIEFDNLAPDTAEELFHGIELLRGWMAKANGGEVYGNEMEKGKRPVLILKPAEGMKAYEDMLVFYAMKNLTKEDCLQAKAPAYQTEWLNIGGQLVAKPDMEQLIADVENDNLRNWDDIHDRFNTLWGDHYKAQKLAHCYGMLCRLAGVDTLDNDLWQQYLTRYNNILDYIDEQKELSRRKDKENTFRNMTYWDDAEREAVLGY